MVSGLRELYGERHPDAISSTAYYAQQLSKCEGYETESARLAYGAYEHAKSLLGSVHPDTRLVGATLGLVLAQCGKLVEAERVLRDVHTAATDCEPGTSIELQVASSNLAQVLAAQGRHPDAVPFAREALDASVALLGSCHNTTLDELASTGWLLEEAGQLDEAERVMRAEVSALRDVLGSARGTNYEYLNALSRLGRLLAGREDADALSEAEALMREDLDASRATHGDVHVDTLAAISNLAQLLYKQRRPAEALPLAREGQAASACLLGSTHEHTRLMDVLVECTELDSAEQERTEPAE